MVASHRVLNIFLTRVTAYTTTNSDDATVTSGSGADITEIECDTHLDIVAEDALLRAGFHKLGEQDINNVLGRASPRGAIRENQYEIDFQVWSRR